MAILTTHVNGFQPGDIVYHPGADDYIYYILSKIAIRKASTWRISGILSNTDYQLMQRCATIALLVTP